MCYSLMYVIIGLNHGTDVNDILKRKKKHVIFLENCVSEDWHVYITAGR